MPPYFTFQNGTITLYLEVIGDTDGLLGFPIDDILRSIVATWEPILQSLNSSPPFNSSPLSIAFVVGPKTVTSGTITFPTPNLKALSPRITATVGTPPNLTPFTLTVGRGAKAIPSTRSAMISYVEPDFARGYIYESPTPQPDPVSSVSHELGHILGLSDRYYDAVYWLTGESPRTAIQCSWGIGIGGVDMTCREIRQGQYLNGAGQDRRVAQSDPFLPARADLQAATTAAARNAIFAIYQKELNAPRFAVRASLPMARVAGDPDYMPSNNLMSSGGSTLTPFQASIFTSAMFSTETQYRAKNWVAVLGAYRRNPQSSADNPYNLSDNTQLRFPAWEADPLKGEGTGLLFLPIPSNITTPQRYACLSSKGAGRGPNGDVTQPVRLATAKGKKSVFQFGGSRYNKIGTNIIFPNHMCYCRQILDDLVSGAVG